MQINGIKLGEEVPSDTVVTVEGTKIYVGLGNLRLSIKAQTILGPVHNCFDEPFCTLDEIWRYVMRGNMYRQYIEVIEDTPLEGRIYRYGNHGEYWELVGVTCGYA